jgi:kojibiose phosphorylase
MHAWVAARLGLVEEAYEHWVEAAGIDLQDTKGNVRDGIHGAANGGLYQALLLGFAGLQLDDEQGWKVDPLLPPWWKSMSFSFYYRGEKQRVTITQ